MKTITTIFWNQGENRLRTGWRLIAQLFLMTIFLSLFQAGFAVLAELVSGDSPAQGSGWNPSTQGLISTLFAALAVTASVLFSSAVLDKRPLENLGLDLSRRWWQDFGLGLGLGALLMALVFSLEFSLGWIEIVSFFQPTPGSPPLAGQFLMALLFFLLIGIYEELFSRGYLLKNLAEGLSGAWLGPRGAIILATLLSSLLFGLLHGANPNATLMGVLNISLAGLLLAAGYLVTGQLGLSIGLHISWNFFQGPVFGFPVSGASWQSGIVFRVLQNGPVLWTGGPFGPEGGLLGSLAILLGIGLIWLWRGRGQGIDLRLSRYLPTRQTPPPTPAILPVGIGRIQGIQHIIWDWNGTLLDDLDLCLEIINGMLAERELPAITRESYLAVFDFPVREYYQRIGFDFSQEPFETVSDQFITAYESGRPDCRLAPGAREVLDHAADLGISQSILSASKASYLTRAVAEYGIEGYFSAIEGLADHHAAGKLDLAQEFRRTCSLDPAEILLVGDTTHDGDIARAIGVGCLLIPRGHHSRSRLEATGHPLINSLLELKEVLD